MCINRHTDWRGTCVSMPRFRYGPRTLQSPLLSLLISYIKKTAVKNVSFLIISPKEPCSFNRWKFKQSNFVCVN